MATASASKQLKLSTGSTKLNLALTNDPTYGLLAGKYYFFVGDSSSGKTWLCLSLLAEAANDPRFKDYQLIYDNVEDGALMNVRKYFGKKAARRIRMPDEEDGLPVCSSTIQDFYYNLADATDTGPCIYICDSMDALTHEDDDAKFEKNKNAYQAGKKETGSYGDGKAKYNSGNLRRALSKVKKSGSILIIICQTRDNVGGFGFETKTRSGGKALRFYATTEIWTSVLKRHAKEVRGQKVRTKTDILVKCKKNRVTGQDSQTEFSIDHHLGIDDTTDLINFLIKTQHWKAPKGVVTAPEFEFKGRVAKLAEFIEEEGDLPILRGIVGKIWKEIQDAVITSRHIRYE
jgi:RecA/RadA recombinase